MIRHFLTLATLLATSLLAAPALAEAPVQQIQATLARPAQMCGRFDQTKQLTGIKKPLQSNGRFCVIAGRGILWQALQPFPNTLRITRDAIQQMQDGRVAMKLDAQQEPVVKMINSVLFSLLAGDLSQLDALFALDGQISNGHWKVALKARQPALARAIGDITLEGGAYVERVLMQEASGDRTDIVFSDIKTGAGAMTAAEGALFD
ncbi:outer membrane lipoprotein carrier protein LolA [Herbaspirillum sp. YR522]|uniref:outer membrane lipoprotein carrier protein LolA n=1 Tax=Herbaspirillum sp. YR522 TaxID=1144342 RepID=UPI00026F5C19|nr:outer membrane lipoprotein carrier protein LolA [Herbaspirillum sp. YR522]EJN09284.1 outer membrane lipoprotein-sorting protein [Herbaspirillum sp. YR522]